MRNKLTVIIAALLLFLPIVMADIKIQLGEPYINIEDVSEIEFNAHSGYYDICAGDTTIIPILIKNRNSFSDTFYFKTDVEYAFLSSKSAVFKSSGSGILLLTLKPAADLQENTTIPIDITTKNEGLKRTLIVKTNIEKCYLFSIELEEDKGEICGCENKSYAIKIKNEGISLEELGVSIKGPSWAAITPINETLEIEPQDEIILMLTANAPCQEKGNYPIAIQAISNITQITKEATLELALTPNKECYNTIIKANNQKIGYSGINIPITIENKGTKDSEHSLTIEGIDWYSLSQTSFNLKSGQKKAINLNLLPSENIVEGNYNVDIKAQVNNQEFVKSITIKLKGESPATKKIKFYLNYYKYYIGLGIIILIVILFLAYIIGKAKKKEKINKKELEIKEKKEEKKIEKNIGAKEISVSKKISILKIISFIIPIILTVIFLSALKYRAFYEKISNLISGFFTKYVLPYSSYIKYGISAIGILIIIFLIIDFFRKKPKKKAKISRERVIKEKPEEKKEIKKVVKKTAENDKTKFSKFFYIIPLTIIFLGIIGYTIFKFFNKDLLNKLKENIVKLSLIKDFIQTHYLYLIIGIVVLSVIIIIIRFIKKRSKKIKPKRKINKKFTKNIVITIFGLVILSGIVYSFVYYNLLSYIKDFFIVYYPYILIGVGILIILVLILHFYKKD